MFKKNEKQKEVVEEIKKAQQTPVTAPEPKEIKELEEKVVEQVPEEPKEDPSNETPVEVESELTEEDAKEYFKEIANVLNNLGEEVRKIKHHLRLDFD